MAKTERIQNMTKGSPAKLIFTFAIPLMLGNVFQQFYTVVDTAIVGQALGVNALARAGAYPRLCAGLFHLHGAAFRRGRPRGS